MAVDCSYRHNKGEKFCPDSHLGKQSNCALRGNDQGEIGHGLPPYHRRPISGVCSKKSACRGSCSRRVPGSAGCRRQRDTVAGAVGRPPYRGRAVDALPGSAVVAVALARVSARRQVSHPGTARHRRNGTCLSVRARPAMHSDCGEGVAAGEDGRRDRPGAFSARGPRRRQSVACQSGARLRYRWRWRVFIHRHGICPRT